MVTITNGIKTFRITAGAIKLYEGMGFHAVADTENQNFDDFDVHDSVSKRSNGENAEDVAFVEELLEKPLSQWSNEEVKDFVRIKGIDTSGAQKVSQVRNIIKTYLEEEQKQGM